MYTIPTQKNFNSFDPMNAIQDAISQLQVQVSELQHSSRAGSRLFLNPDQVLPLYFNQPADMWTLSPTNTDVNTNITVNIDADSENYTTINFFGTNPLQTLFKDTTSIVVGDTVMVSLSLQATGAYQWYNSSNSTDLSLQFSVFMFDPIAYSFTNLNDQDVSYAIKPTITSGLFTQTFELPVVNSWTSTSPTTQLFIKMNFLNTAPQPLQLNIFFGPDQPSWVSCDAFVTQQPPENSFIFADVDNELQSCCFQLFTEGPVLEPVAFQQPQIFISNATGYYFNPVHEELDWISQQNWWNTQFEGNPYATTGPNSYILRVTDVYDPSQYGVYQMGPSSGNLEFAPFMYMFAGPISGNGYMVPGRVYSFEYQLDWVGTGPSSYFFFVNGAAPRLDQEQVQASLAALKETKLQHPSSSSLMMPQVFADYPSIQRTPVQYHHTLTLRVNKAEPHASDVHPWCHQPMLLSAPKIPANVDLRSKMPPIIDQGQLGSCSACAFAGSYGFVKQGFIGSPLFCYYNERVVGKYGVNIDSGSTLSVGVASLKQYGMCLESLWPYDITKFADKPSTNAYNDAVIRKIKTANKVSVNVNSMKNILASGLPIVVGFEVYTSFMSATVARTGVVPQPGAREQLLGGHAVVVVGYNDSTSRFLCRNSWGTSWGSSGYFTIPYTYLGSSKYAGDFWVIASLI